MSFHVGKTGQTKQANLVITVILRVPFKMKGDATAHRCNELYENSAAQHCKCVEHVLKMC